MVRFCAKIGLVDPQPHTGDRDMAEKIELNDPRYFFLYEPTKTFDENVRRNADRYREERDQLPDEGTERLDFAIRMVKRSAVFAGACLAYEPESGHVAQCRDCVRVVKSNLCVHIAAALILNETLDAANIRDGELSCSNDFAPDRAVDVA
jgi:hypothetical protein